VTAHKPKLRVVGWRFFWLNVYYDALNVGSDLLTGNGIARFTALRTLENKLKESSHSYYYVMIDLPPSFGGLVRSALYLSDYLLIPCTSDTFSEYCIGLISQMLPHFINDLDTGLTRFKQNNYGSSDYDGLGRPRYAGWIFNGDDTRSGKLLRADAAHYSNIDKANSILARTLKDKINNYDAVIGKDNFNIGNVEDINVLIQNSLWQNVPAAKLAQHLQVRNLTRDKQKWSDVQLVLIDKVSKQINAIPDRIIADL
jgi:chromosome partitioning protein